MNDKEPTIYRGPWPQNVSKLAKYAVKIDDGSWKITVLCDLGGGLTYLAVEGGGSALADRINGLKQKLRGQLGGPFYVNEFRHVIVPVTDQSGSGTGSHYYYAGKAGEDFEFEFNGQPLTTRPVDPDGQPLKPGSSWLGPRPGVPYVLAAGGNDIYYETPALTDADPPSVMKNVTRRVQLSKVLNDQAATARATRPIREQRGHQGGRFYVNEHGAIFTPVAAGDGNGLDYVYCGKIDLKEWFPEPPVP